MSHAAYDMLDGAASVLRELAPGLAGEARYAALLTANAVATARRDLALAEAVAVARAALQTDAAAIRRGDHDGDAPLYARLTALADLRAWIADPSTGPRPAAMTEALP